MCLVGAVPWVRGGLIVFSQLIGGISAAGIVSALYPGPLNVRTTLGAGTSKAQGVFIEMFLTAELVFTIFMLAAEKHKGTFIAPIGIGLALFIAELGGMSAPPVFKAYLSSFQVSTTRVAALTQPAPSAPASSSPSSKTITG